MRRFALALLIACFAANTCLGRIGETEAQIEQRLGTGKPDEPFLDKPKNSTSKAYEKNGFRIVVGFYQGVSQYEQYDKKGESLSDDEINIILGNNAFSGSWKFSGESDYLRVYAWTTDKMNASYIKGERSPFLVIQTKEFESVAEAERKGKEQNSAKGL